MKKSNFIQEKEYELQWKERTPFRLPSHMVEDGEFIRPDKSYERQHPLEIEVKKYIKDKNDIQQGDVLMGITEEDLRDMQLEQHETTYLNCFNFFSISVVRMKRDVFETLKSGLKRYIEFSEKELHDGINYQGEIRSYSKDYEGVMNDDGKIEYAKVKNPMTQAKIDNALSFMKKMAVLVVEREFELRFKNFKNCHDVEQESWAYQVPEAKALLKNPEASTPFLNILSITRGIDKTVLAKKVIKNHDKYVVDYAALLGKYHAIKSQFKHCDNMWDMNILYEDYLSVGMPFSQAEKMGRCDENYIRTDGVDIKYGTFGF